MSTPHGASTHPDLDTPLVVLPSDASVGPLAERVSLRSSTEALKCFNLLAFSANAEAALRLVLSRPQAVRALVLAAAEPPADPTLGERLASLQLPVLVVLGTRDAVAPPPTGTRWRALLPGCHVAFLYDAGRDLAADRPDAFADIVADFLREPGAFLVNRRDGSVRYE